jgi:regulator of replication initiation timing
MMTRHPAGTLKVVAWLAGVTTCAMLAGCPLPKATAPKTPAEEIVLVSQDIEALQFVNSLQLQSAQIGPLREVLDALVADQQKLDAERDKLRSALLPLLQQKRDALRAQQATVDLDTKIRDVQGKLTNLASADPDVVKKQAGKLRGVLTREQVAMATGELDARIQATQMLDAYRTFPSDEFQSQIKPFAEELVSRGSTMTADQVAALFTDARSLSEDEYKENKEKLVNQLLPLFAPAPEAADQLLVDAFSHPRMIEALPSPAGASKTQTPVKGTK